MNLSTIIEAAIQAGATNAVIIAIVKAAESEQTQKLITKRAKDADRKRMSRMSRGQPVTPSDSTDSSDTLPPDGFNGFPDPSLTSLTPLKEKTPKGVQKKVSLAELSVDHIRDWLAEKRTLGRYLCHDEHFILDQFKNYCQSKGKIYADYIAGYRNAFEWERCQPQTPGRSSSQNARPTWRSEGERLRAKYAAEAELEEQAAALRGAGAGLCVTENVWQDAGGTGNLG